MKFKNLEDIEDPFNIPDRSRFGRNDPYWLSEFSEEEYEALEELYHINDLHILHEEEYNNHFSDEIDFAGIDFPLDLEDLEDLDDSEN